MSAKAFWIIEKRLNDNFPYRLLIKQDTKILLSLLVKDKWPGQKGHIFCIRDDEDDNVSVDDVIETVPVISIKRYGKRLSVVLDRSINKRCDFLFLTKQYKTKEGEYEQIFWRTNKVLKESKTRAKLSTYYKGCLDVIIDSAERYPWGFPGCKTKRRKLPVGDYALINNEALIAVVERKTFDNIFAEFGRMQIFHNQLNELSAYKYSALVIEANYSDFFKPDKLKYYSSSFIAKAIGEIHAMHPSLSIVFAGKRKFAVYWTHRFFEAVDFHENDNINYKVAEVVDEYKQEEVKGGTYYTVREQIINNLNSEFTMIDLKNFFKDIPTAIIKRVLNDLQKEGFIECRGSGKQKIWEKTIK